MIGPAAEPPLTSLAHGGGCGCKIAPAQLRRIMSQVPAAAAYERLLVGPETSDDAAVWRLDETTALVATTDFFMPMVDDPFDFGRIAAANALSDVYAMGGRPILALAILGAPVATLSEPTIANILAGGAAICAEAGVPVAGGHSIDSVEPIYGLAVVGLVHPDRIRTNRGARAGDSLILTKPLGVGILSAAFRQGRLTSEGYAELLSTTALLNRVGPDLAARSSVHAMTDVTGFGLLGHAREMAEGSGVELEIWPDQVPVLPEALALVRAGVRTGASRRNYESLDPLCLSPLEFAERDLLCDPQTSGGLLLAVAPEDASEILEAVRAAGFPRAKVVGTARTGAPALRVRPSA